MKKHAVYKLSLAMMKNIYSHSDEIQKNNLLILRDQNLALDVRTINFELYLH